MVAYNVDFFRKNIDYTMVGPQHGIADQINFLRTATENHVSTVYLSPGLISSANVIGHSIDIGSVVGFPFGYFPLHIKIAEMASFRGNLRWVDVPINIVSARAHSWHNVEKEIATLSGIAKGCNYGIKLIIEAPYLTDEEILIITKIADPHVDYIKTATGVGNKVELRHVELIKPLLKHAKLKAAGGIVTLDEAIRFFDAGADIIGSSKGFEILEEAKRRWI